MRHGGEGVIGGHFEVLIIARNVKSGQCLGCEVCVCTVPYNLENVRL